jgi:acyl-CoA synthetase (AMP-forming)/AMP-acid ligase II
VEANKLRFTTMRRTAVGGSAMPLALIAKFADEYGVEVRHGWGMTETTAVATMSALMSKHDRWPPPTSSVVAKQGATACDQGGRRDGATLPRDGSSQGELMVRGQWIVSGYFKGESSPLQDGWFPTGDVATIDADGVMQIRDRAKDVIKTGGEWISSIDLENAAMGTRRRDGGGDRRQAPEVGRAPAAVHRAQAGAGAGEGRDPRLPGRARGHGGCRTTWSSSTRCRWVAPAAEGRPAQAVRRRVQLTGGRHAHRTC